MARGRQSGGGSGQRDECRLAGEVQKTRNRHLVSRNASLCSQNSAKAFMAYQLAGSWHPRKWVEVKHVA